MIRFFQTLPSRNHIPPHCLCPSLLERASGGVHSGAACEHVVALIGLLVKNDANTSTRFIASDRLTLSHFFAKVHILRTIRRRHS